MMLKDKHDQWVLETVDCLRQRKARPDLERIGRMVERFHGLTLNETKESLQRLTDEGVVMKVYFKGNISYRHVRKLERDKETKGSPTNQVYNTSLRIAHAIRSIVKQTGDRASFSDLEAWLISKNPETRLVKHRLQTALNREKDSGNISQFPDGTYNLTEDHPQNDSQPKTNAPDMNENDDLATAPNTPNTPKKKSDVPKPETGSSETCTVNRNDNSKGEVEGSPKRGRPLSKRKKFKKTHGPDFENPLKVKKTSNKDEEKPSADVCGYCSKTADSNNEGKTEPLLSCKDCESKAHPSCMDYSPDLARRALDSPWQCMDCKTCFVCDGSENAELMLFCDACDKGYHMTCHEPPLVNKPKGKWICSLCREEVRPERKSQDRTDSVPKQNNKKGVTKTERVSDDSLDGEDDESKKSKKRKLSRQKSAQPAKRIKSEATSDDNSTGMTSKQTYDDYADGTVGPACFPTPSASPRPGDTFEYELKMSRLGFPSSIVEDNTTYSDASNWNTDDVVKFFEECGFQDQAQAFKDQEIDGPSLLLMQRNDVLTGLGLKLGPALKIYHKVVRLQIFSQVSDTSSKHATRKSGSN